MIVITYKLEKGDGVVYIPASSLQSAEKKANSLYNRGYLNVKIVDVSEKVLYTPS